MKKHALKNNTNTTAELSEKYILVVDDLEINYNLFYYILNKMNIRSIWAANGKEAVELSKTHPEINLVLMDLLMPIMNGYTATRMIKENNPEIKIIAQTAYGLTEDKEKCIRAGCSDYIAKPFNLAEFRTVISKYF